MSGSSYLDFVLSQLFIYAEKNKGKVNVRRPYKGYVPNFGSTIDGHFTFFDFNPPSYLMFYTCRTIFYSVINLL